MKEIQRLVAEQREAERRDDVPHADETNLRIRLDDGVRARRLDPAGLDEIAEVDRRRRAAAEAGDVDDPIGLRGRPVLAEGFVRLVEARQLAQPEDAAEDLAQDVEPRPDAFDVVVVLAGRPVIGLVEADDVGVVVALVFVVFLFVPRAVECV